MPLVNIYFKQGADTSLLKAATADLRNFLAQQLSDTDLALTPQEFSVRFLFVADGEMIADIEVEIAAHAFADRVKRQDEICRAVQKFIKEKTNAEVQVWLKLSELGHSWK